MPHRIGRYGFAIVEGQFVTAGITDDKMKFTILTGNLETWYLEKMEDIVLNPPATGRYEKLKGGLIRALAESDSDRVTRLVENEVMGDRKPSQFYHDLKKLASRSALD